MMPFEPVLLIVAVNCVPDTVTVPVKNWSKLEQLPELFVRHVNPMVDADAEGAATNIRRTATRPAPNLFKLTLCSNSSGLPVARQGRRLSDSARAIPAQDDRKCTQSRLPSP